jgi:hypothetical protein
MVSAIKLSNNAVILGNDHNQTITLTAIDADTFKVIEGATVAITVDTPNYVTAYSLTSMTNPGGQMIYTIPITKNNTSPGDYITYIQIIKQGYEPLSDSIHFMILPNQQQ